MDLFTFKDNSTSNPAYQATVGVNGGQFQIGVGSGNNLALGIHPSGGLALGTGNYGTAGQVLTTQGQNTLPTWTTISGGATSIGGLSDAITTATSNIGLGSGALDSLTASSGNYNVALGINAGTTVSTGDRNILIGFEAGKLINTGGDHVMIGHTAGAAITNQNTGVFVGYRAGVSSTGYSETVVGSQAGTNGTGYNTVVGHNAMTSGTGSANTFIGWNAGQGVASNAANQNVGVGADSLKDLTTGSYNLAVGRKAGQNITSGQKNIILTSNDGASSLTTGSYNVLIGGADVSSATVGQSLTISDGSGTLKWITADNAGDVTIPSGGLTVEQEFTAKRGRISSLGSSITLTDTYAGRYIIVSGTATLPDGSTVAWVKDETAETITLTVTAADGSLTQLVVPVGDFKF